MASQLYKVLNNIDKGRNRIVNTFKNKGYIIAQNSSLDTIADSLDELLPIKLKDGAEVMPDGVTYYNNPEDDPEVWTEYKQWPDLHKIFKDITTVTYEGKTYYPQTAILFQTSVKEISIKHDAMVSDTKQIANNEIYTGFDRNESLLSLPSGKFIKPYYENYTITIPSITLTDEDKIKGQDGKDYYYIITYISTDFTSEAVTYLSIGTGADITVLEWVADPCFSYLNNTSSRVAVYASEKAAKDLKVLYFTDPTFPRSEINKTRPTMLEYSGSYPKLDLSKFKGLKVLVFDMAAKETQKQSEATMMSYPFNAPNLNTIINTNQYIGAVAATPSSVIYYKTPTFCGATIDFSSSSAGSQNYLLYVNQLKYLDITDLIAHQELSSKTCYCDTNTTTYKKTYYGTYPYLRNQEAFKYCTSYLTTSPFRYSFKYVDNLHVNYPTWPINIASSNNPQTVLQCFSVPAVTIHGLTTAYGAYFLDVDNLNTVVMPDVTRLSASSYGVSSNASSMYAKTTYSIKKLVLPQLIEIFSGYSSDTVSELKLISYTLTNIHMPSLQQVPSAVMFRYCMALQTLELGSDWSSSLNFKDNYMLFKSSVLDLFNKLKTLNEEEIAEGKSITLPDKGPSAITNFTEEEIAIATNKGWEVK